ncbi:MAG: 2-hydroxyglutaryl-CoA dehydratase [Anaerolineae bacterium]|nr:2-hydroxyglutaryl-CoA dehydratase [Anaerolineae bacterium]
MDAYLGLDIGSVTTKLIALDAEGALITSLYTRTLGRPIEVTQNGVRRISQQLGNGWRVRGVATTGSARKLIGVVAGADVVKNEITAHAVGALHYVPDVRTIIEIGGQDSKVIMLRDGIVTDFAMNSVCAAGTGSFLDQQAYRLNIPIEEFGALAVHSETPVRIAGRCTVFAESDMIHKQQMGHRVEDILYGLCQALARNYLNNLCLGKEILGPVVFQGGVAANVGMVRALEEALGMPVTVPPHYNVMGAIGAAILAQEHMSYNGKTPTRFRGWEMSEIKYETSSFECQGCPNLCEVVQIRVGEEILARWGGRCGKWEM